MRSLFTALLLLSVTILYSNYPYRYPQFRYKTYNSAFKTVVSQYNSNKWQQALHTIDSVLNTKINSNDKLLFCNTKAEILAEHKRANEAITVLRDVREKTTEDKNNREYIENYVLESKIQFQLKDYKTSIEVIKKIDSLLTGNRELRSVRALSQYDLSQIHMKLMDIKSSRAAVERGLKIIDKPENSYEKALRYFLLAERAGREQPYIKTENYRASSEILTNSNQQSCFLNYLCLLKTVIQYAQYENNNKKAKAASKKTQQFINNNSYSGAKTYPFYIATGVTLYKLKDYKNSEINFNKARDIAVSSFGDNSFETLLADTYLGRLNRYAKNYQKSENHFKSALHIGKTGWKGEKFPNEFRLYGEMSKLYSDWNKPYKSLEFANKRLNYYYTDSIIDVNTVIPKHKKIKDISYYRTLLEKIQAYRYLYLKTNNDKYLRYGLKHCKQADHILNIINNKSISERAGLKNSARIKVIASYAMWFNLKHYNKYKDETSIKNALYQTDKTLANYLKYELRCRTTFPDKVTETIKKDIRALESKMYYSDNKRIYRDSILTLKNMLVNNTYRRSDKRRIIKNIDSWINNINPNTILDNIDKNTAIFIIQDMHFINEKTDKINNLKNNKYISVFYADNNSISYNMIDSTKSVERDLKQAIKAIKTINSKNTDIHMRELSRRIIYPFADKLKDKENIVFMIGNKLSKIPFEAMYLNAESDKQLLSYNTSYNYSLALYLKDEAATNSNNILAIAPDFSSNGKVSEVRSYWIDDSDNKRGRARTLASLPMAQEEVKEIKNICQNRPKLSYKTLTTNTSKSSIIELMPDYDIIHFATHGFVDKRDYKNSGLFLNNTGNNSLLHLNEIYNLKLNTNLVVLSACKTNIGNTVNGEGNMALPRAFKYAGVKNIIASLWNVNDNRSKKFMTMFYKNVVNNNMTYAQALKKTKTDCKNAGYKTIDWAGFVLIGK
jgi:CHAT domain-containing protein